MTVKPMRTRLAVGVAAIAVLVPTSAVASTGVGIDVGRIAINAKLTPGGSYRLPAIGVRNPGTERASYRMGARPLEGATAPPDEWFSFSPRTFTLKPGETQPVRVRLTLPASANPDDYTTLVGAELVGGDAKGARVGAAAAARTTFTVEPANFLQARWLQLKRFVGDNAPWTWLVPALFAFGFAAWTVRRRFSFTVARRA